MVQVPLARVAGDCAPADETAASDAHIPTKRKCGDLENTSAFPITDTARALREHYQRPPAVCWISGAPISTMLTGLVPPRWVFRQRASGSAWSDWCPVIGRVPAGSAGRLDYRRTGSARVSSMALVACTWHGACAPIRCRPPSAGIRFIWFGIADVAAGPGALAPGAGRTEPVEPIPAPRSQAQQPLLRRSKDASWCSLPIQNRRYIPAETRCGKYHVHCYLG